VRFALLCGATLDPADHTSGGLHRGKAGQEALKSSYKGHSIKKSFSSSTFLPVLVLENAANRRLVSVFA